MYMISKIDQYNQACLKQFETDVLIVKRNFTECSGYDNQYNTAVSIIGSIELHVHVHVPVLVCNLEFTIKSSLFTIANYKCCTCTHTEEQH